MCEALSRHAARRGRTLKLYPVDGMPSGADSVVYGGDVSNPRYWKHVTTGQTYGEWRKQRVGAEGAA